MSGPRDLAGLVASRICHDLISPVGALGNGMELVEAAGGAMSEELELIRSCSDAARHSLTYMRIAFGAAAPADTIDPSEAASAAVPYLAAKRLEVRWPQSGVGRSRLEVKARLLTLFAASDAAPRGGVVAPVDPAALIWRVTGKALQPETASAGLACREGAASCAREVHYPVLRNAAQSLGKTPFVTALDDERFEIGMK